MDISGSSAAGAFDILSLYQKSEQILTDRAGQVKPKYTASASKVSSLLSPKSTPTVTSNYIRRDAVPNREKSAPTAADIHNPEKPRNSTVSNDVTESVKPVKRRTKRPRRPDNVHTNNSVTASMIGRKKPARIDNSDAAVDPIARGVNQAIRIDTDDSDKTITGWNGGERQIGVELQRTHTEHVIIKSELSDAATVFNSKPQEAKVAIKEENYASSSDGGDHVESLDNGRHSASIGAVHSTGLDDEDDNTMNMSSDDQDDDSAAPSPQKPEAKGKKPSKVKSKKRETNVITSTKCDQCGKVYKSPRNLQHHMMIHTGEKPHACTECTKRFAHASDLRRHIRNHTGEKPYACSICDKRFISSSGRGNHEKLHSDERAYVCTECGKSFAQPSGLSSHMYSHSTDKPLTCAVCDRRFARTHVLRNHMLTHTGEKPHVCIRCGQQFAQIAHLMRHMLSHSGERCHTCEICSRKFVTPTALSKHMHSHTCEKKHVCTDCGKKCVDCDSLERHMLAGVHNPHECSTCGKMCSSASALHTHTRIHTGETPHVCKRCNRGFIGVGSLNRHMLTHTGKNLIHKTNQLQKRALRVIHNAPYNSHTDPKFRKLSNILKLNDLFEYQSLICMHDYLSGKLPISFDDLLMENFHTIVIL